MYLHGSFTSKKGDIITVYILTDNDKTEEVVIGEESSGVFFAGDDPCVIDSQINDTFDHILPHSATITLLSDRYLPSLYQSTCRNAKVTVYKDAECVFAGFLEPQTFSQDYNEALDEIQLNCIDCLSALQYSNYKNIGSAGVSYAEVKAGADQRKFLDIMTEMLQEVWTGTDIPSSASIYKTYYDGSKKVDGTYSILTDIAVSELLFLDEDEDSVWTQQAVLDEMMRYLNLHIMQMGANFYIFSWETIRKGGSVTWKNITGSGNLVTTSNTIDITTDIVADCGCQIEVGDTYNQLSLTDSVQEIENVIESPLDEDSLSYAYDGKQKYMTEYISDGSGTSSKDGFKDLVRSGSTSYDGGSVTDWFVQIRKNDMWKFYAPGKVDVISKYCSTGKNQQGLPNAMGKECGVSAILSVGKVKKDNGGNDNSPVSSIDMSNYLVISTCGNDTDSEDAYYPQDDDIKAAIPVAEYIGNEAGGNFSPNDDDTTNYIVISGKVILNPLMIMSCWYNPAHNSDCSDLGIYTPGVTSNSLGFAGLIPVIELRNGNNRYTRQHWKAASWQDAVTNDTTPDNDLNRGFIPFTDNGPQNYKFEYSSVGDSTDQISKVAVVACMLIIGDKVCVEKLPSEGGSGNGQFSDFEWRTYKERSQCSSDDEYYQQCFTIGFDPAIGDYLIGKEYDIQNNISYTDGVDAQGTAIPIRKSDKVSGKVQFKILGPVNTIWEEVTRRHPTFFRHTKWGSNSIPLLAHTSNILLKEFEVKVYSDNAKMGSGDDEDIVYMSDTKETYVNKKDDLEFKITTALTSAEAKSLGVKNSVKLSSPTTASGDALMSITDTNSGDTAKPEQLYVDAYWREWHEPRVVMTQNFEDGTHISPWNLYRHPAIGKTFHVEGISRNLYEGTAEITMKEIF